MVEAAVEMILKSLFKIYQSKDACTLIPGRQATTDSISLFSVFNHHSGINHSDMNRMGFVKSGDFFIRKDCADCAACKAIRLHTDLFKPSKTQRHTIAANADLTVERVVDYDPNEHYSLYSLHRKKRFPKCAPESKAIINVMIETKPYPSDILEFRLNGKLVGAMIYNQLDDGLSANASYYDPFLSQDRSLGTFMILEIAKRVKESGKPYLYLGTWTDEPSAYSYKSSFQPAEIRNRDGRWTPLKQG